MPKISKYGKVVRYRISMNVQEFDLILYFVISNVLLRSD